jgi:FKBP-type peptidyl-prolyl cis-trans isomerase FkpA
VYRVFLVLMTVCLCGSVSAQEFDNQAGMKYWNGIDKEAVETDSGLQYKVLIEGNGRKPTSKDKVEVHYRGLMLNGVTFDTSYTDDEPISFRLKNMIKGWIEGVQLMPVGSVFVFLIPPELAYGDKGSRSIPANSTLIFEIDLFAIK